MYVHAAAFDYDEVKLFVNRTTPEEYSSNKEAAKGEKTVNGHHHKLILRERERRSIWR